MNYLFPIIYSILILLFPYWGKLRHNQQTLNTIVISLGLLGTFVCIIYGLLNFNTNQLNHSIPILLEGLKTAILTTLTGLFTSILLKLCPSIYGIKKEKLSEQDPLAKEILNILCEIRRNMNLSSPTPAQQPTDHNPEMQELLHQHLQQVLSTLQEMNANINALLNKPDAYNMDISKILKEQIGQITFLVKNNEEQLKQQIDQIEEKRQKEIKELENFTKTMMSIIKKLNQDHNALYKSSDTTSLQ